MNIPENLRYRESHEWINPADNPTKVGISDHAQHELTDVVFVDLPKVGASVKAGDQVCVIESVKAASDIYAPVSGEITAVNEALQNEPGLINTDPYFKGWIFEIKPASPAEFDVLLTAEAYKASIA
jgi:glycine cleavage system H protein